MRNLFILLFIAITTIHLSGQDVQEPSAFFFDSSLRTNITESPKTGIGLRLSAGYKISNYFSLLLSTGFMKGFTNAHTTLSSLHYDPVNDKTFLKYKHTSERTQQFIPVSLSIRYNYNFEWFSPYVFYQIGVNFFQNDYRTNTTYTQTKEGGSPPVTNSLTNSVIPTSVSDLSAGLGAGLIIPVTDRLNLDVSYLFMSGSYTTGMQSLGLGINFAY